MGSHQSHISVRYEGFACNDRQTRGRISGQKWNLVVDITCFFVEYFLSLLSTGAHNPVY